MRTCKGCFFFFLWDDKWRHVTTYTFCCCHHRRSLSSLVLSNMRHILNYICLISIRATRGVYAIFFLKQFLSANGELLVWVLVVWIPRVPLRLPIPFIFGDPFGIQTTRPQHQLDSTEPFSSFPKWKQFNNQPLKLVVAMGFRDVLFSVLKVSRLQNYDP